MNLIVDDPYWLYLQASLLGLIIGSFLNVVVYRLPQILEQQWGRECSEFLGLESTIATETLNLSYPPSHCPHCKHRILAWENIPIISYIILRGRCSSCSKHISLRYPITELLCAILTVIVVARFGSTWQTIAALILTWGLLALSLIDYDTQLLPDIITIPLLWIGLLASITNTFTDPATAILGAAIGYMSLWTLFHLFRLATGKEGMGYGDFKLLAVFGAWLGWQSLPMIILLSSCTGAAIGMVLIMIRRQQRDCPVPFGHYLAAAGWLNLVWGDQLNHLYLTWARLA